MEHSDLLDLVEYDRNTGHFTWRRGRRGARAGARIGSPTTKDGYWRVKVMRQEYRAHRLAWFYVMGAWPDDEIDHRDGDPMNNAWSNLRLATRSQQTANKKARKDSSAPYKGISFCKQTSRWRASIETNGTSVHLGRFDTPEEAAAAYEAAAIMKSGVFASIRSKNNRG